MPVSKHKYVVILRQSNDTVRVLNDVYIDYKVGIMGYRYRNERTDVNQIDDKVWRIEEHYKGSGIWNDSIAVFNIEHPDYIQTIEKFGLEEDIKMFWSAVCNFEYVQKNKDMYTSDEVLFLMKECL